MKRSDLEYIAEVAKKAGEASGSWGVGTACFVSSEDPSTYIACYAVVLTDSGIHSIFSPGVGGSAAQAEEDLLSIVKRVHKKL